MPKILSNTATECFFVVSSQHAWRRHTGGNLTTFDGIRIKPGEANEQGFNEGLLNAFAYHKTLELTPDDLHLLLLQGIALFVQTYPEDFRQQLPFLPRSGQETLMVEATDMPIRGDLKAWGNMTKGFVALLKKKVSIQDSGEKFIELVTKNYSTSTEIDRTIKEVTLLSTFSPFYKYLSITFCGIPRFILKGSEADWQQLYELPDAIIRFFGYDPSRIRQDDLSENQSIQDANRTTRCMVLWLSRVKHDFLHYFLQARLGNFTEQTDYKPEDFWLNFYKYRDASHHSGGMPYVNGRILLMFPILAEDDNNSDPQKAYKLNMDILDNRKKLEDFLQGHGVLPNSLPKNTASCIIQYANLTNGKKAKLTFKGGFFQFAERGTPQNLRMSCGYNDNESINYFRRELQIHSDQEPPNKVTILSPQK